MSPHDDDLAEFADDPILRALRGPATPGELAGEAEALAAFRAAVPRRTRRRYVGRLGVGGSALGIAIAMTGGVAAAAYSSSLPFAVQRPLNTWLGSIGVPAPHHHHHHHVISSAVYHQPTPAAGPPATSSGVLTTGSPSARPSPTPQKRPPARHHKPKHPGATPSGSLAASSSTPPSATPTPTPTDTSTLTPTPTPTPTDTPTPTPTPTPTDTPTPTPTPTDSPASITIAVSSTKIVAGGRVSVAAHLATASGRPVRHHSIRLLERQAGSSEQHMITIGTTGSNGSVMLSTPPLTTTVLLRLTTAQGFRSAAVKVVAAPIVSQSVSRGATADTISATVTGGVVGDVLELRERSHGTWFAVATARLSSPSVASFSVAPPSKGAAHYRLVLRATHSHSSASSTFAIPAT